MCFKSESNCWRLGEVPVDSRSIQPIALWLCPKCGYVHPKNRTGDKFVCQHDGHMSYADRVDTYNHKEGSEIRRILSWMLRNQLHAILLERFSTGTGNRQIRILMSGGLILGGRLQVQTNRSGWTQSGSDCYRDLWERRRIVRRGSSISRHFPGE